MSVKDPAFVVLNLPFPIGLRRDVDHAGESFQCWNGGGELSEATAGKWCDVGDHAIRLSP